MTRPVRLITELVGTFIFLSVIALSGPVGPLAPLAIGTALMAMVYMGGHISGAHYNPAVSFGAFLSRKLGAQGFTRDPRSRSSRRSQLRSFSLPH